MFLQILFISALFDYSTVSDSRGEGAGKNLENLISGGGVQISGEDKLGNPDLKIRYDFALFMPIFKLTSFICYANIPFAKRK